MVEKCLVFMLTQSQKRRAMASFCCGCTCLAEEDERVYPLASDERTLSSEARNLI